MLVGFPRHVKDDSAQVSGQELHQEVSNRVTMLEGTRSFSQEGFLNDEVAIATDQFKGRARTKKTPCSVLGPRTSVENIWDLT